MGGDEKMRKEIILENLAGSLVEASEKLSLEQAGLKELCSNTEFLSAKRGGREPGVHKWGR